MSWFKHDCGSLNDDRLGALVLEYGVSGYGVFYLAAEFMFDNDGVLGQVSIKRIAKEFSMQSSKVMEILDYASSEACRGLFEKTSDGYTNKRIVKEIEHLENLSETRRKSANKRWKGRQDNEIENAKAEQMECNTDANAMQMQSKSKAYAEQEQCKSNANAMQIERKIDRTKERPAISDELAGKEKCEDKPASRPGNGMPEIVLKDGSRWTPPETYIVTKQKAYPAVDVMAELWKMAGKTSQRPQSRPLPFNLDGFVNGWLDNAVRDMDRPKARDPDRRIVTDHEERMKGVNPDGTYTI